MANCILNCSPTGFYVYVTLQWCPSITRLDPLMQTTGDSISQIQHDDRSNYLYKIMPVPTFRISQTCTEYVLFTLRINRTTKSSVVSSKAQSTSQPSCTNPKRLVAEFNRRRTWRLAQAISRHTWCRCSPVSRPRIRRTRRTNKATRPPTETSPGGGAEGEQPNRADRAWYVPEHAM